VWKSPVSLHDRAPRIAARILEKKSPKQQVHEHQVQPVDILAVPRDPSTGDCPPASAVWPQQQVDIPLAADSAASEMDAIDAAYSFQHSRERLEVHSDEGQVLQNDFLTGPLSPL